MHAKKARKKGHVKKFPKGRVCKKQGCKHALSIYNSELYCHVHLNENQN